MEGRRTINFCFTHALVYCNSVICSSSCLVVRAQGDQLLDLDIHLLIRLLALHDPVTGTRRHLLPEHLQGGVYAPIFDIGPYLVHGKSQFSQIPYNIQAL